ncbi:MAG: class I SAM-dependent methyltransferase [archaeon]
MLKDYDYDYFAKYYDIFELDEKDVRDMNHFLLKTLKKYPTIKSIADLTCGTGLQVFHLLENGYSFVLGSDISKNMIEEAKKKAKARKLTKAEFYVKDMRNARFGNKKFDCVITLFNAIAHVTKDGFNETVKNVGQNLNPNGYYIVDIINKDYWVKECQAYEFLDTAMSTGDMKYVRFCKYEIKKGDILNDTQKIYIQEQYLEPRVITKNWDAQMYSYYDLEKSLKKNGFKIIEVYGDFEFSKFNKQKSESIVLVTQKIK